MTLTPRSKSAGSAPHGAKWDRHEAATKEGAPSRTQRVLIALILAVSVASALKFVPILNSRASFESHKKVRVIEGTPAPNPRESSSAPAAVDAPLTAAAPDDPQSKKGAVAVCLAGGLRAFQLTAASISQHLLPAFPEADVFVHAPLDETSHKIFLLTAPPHGLGSVRLRAVKFLAQSPLDESSAAAALLTATGSPNGIQGLLQYFELVEGCFGLIEEAEEQQGFKYEWIVRTRPDGFWMGPAPPLSQLDPNGYTFPAGSDWGGANDRIGITRRALAEPTLRRLSMLSALVGKVKGARLNSETGLKAQLQVHHIPARRIAFRFCTLTFHRYQFPPKRWQVPVFSLASTAPLNAAKCRPCVPEMTGEAAFRYIAAFDPRLGLPFRAPVDYHTGLDVCNAAGPWPPDWPALYDAQAGEASAATRRWYLNLTVPQCSANLAEVLSSTQSYEGPSAELLCAMREWGPLLMEPPVFGRGLSCASIVYSVHMGGGSRRLAARVKWEQELMQSAGVRSIVFWFPPGVTVVKLEQLKTSPIPACPTAGSWFVPSVAKIIGSCKQSVVPMAGTDIPKGLLAGKVNVLRVGQTELVEPFLEAVLAAPAFPVCQLILPFQGSSRMRPRAVEALKEQQFDLIRCSGAYKLQHCIFVSLKHC